MMDKNLESDDMSQTNTILTTICKRLSVIEDQLREVVRLEEKVNNHDKTLSRFGGTLESHTNLIHNLEMVQSQLKGSVKELQSLKVEVEDLRAEKDKNSVYKTISAELFKWLGVITCGFALYNLTGG